LKLMPSVDYKEFNFENFDANPYLVGLAKGQCLELKTGTVRAIRKEDYLTKSIGVTYEESADCPIWKRSILEWCVGDIELANYLKQLVGYSLSGLTVDQRLYFLYGNGRNGKSVFIHLIGALYGQNRVNIEAATLMTIKRDGSAATPDVAAMAGARVVTCNETPNKGAFNEAFIKQFTAGDPITARTIYSNVFTFNPVAKLFISGNHKPIIHGRTDGIWRRITLIPFEADIENPDPFLKDKLLAELSGILNWAIEGWEEYKEKGELIRPQVVEDACKEYRSEMDVLSSWIDEVVEKDPIGKLYMQPFYENYKSSFIEQGMTPMSLPAFRKELRRMFGDPQKDSAGTFFKGYRFRTQG
jgi:putative DNA primase/helicase